jgi:hypothetical protein
MSSKPSIKQSPFERAGWKRHRGGWLSPDKRFSILPDPDGYYVLDMDTFNEETVRTPSQALAAAFRLAMKHARRRG